MIKQSRRHNSGKSGGPSHPTLVKRTEPDDDDDDGISSLFVKPFSYACTTEWGELVME